MRSLLKDFRNGLLQIRRAPGIALVMIITLALGIGANTAIFSILDALLLRNLPVRQPESLAAIEAIYRNGTKVPFSYPTFQLLQQNQRAFTSIFGWTGGSRANAEMNGVPVLCTLRGVTANYYSEMGAVPLLGRLIGQEDAAGTSGSPVAVIGYEFWRDRLGSDPTVIGKTIQIEGEQFTMIGVTRRWFTGMTPGEAADITIPLTAGPLAQNAAMRQVLWIHVTGRLKPGLTAEQALMQLQSLWHDVLVQTAPTATPGQRLQSWLAMGLEVTPAGKGVNRFLRLRFERPLWILMGVSAVMVLVACVNLAGLILARSAARNREISVRMSLGATRLRIARQLFAESLLLCGAGAVLALALAYWTSHILVAWMGEGNTVPVILDVRPDWRVFGYTALMAIGAGIMIALAPTWQTSRNQPSAALQTDDRVLARGTGRLGKGLIVAQIALSFALLLGAGLLLRTFQNLRSFDPEFQRTGVLQLTLQKRVGSSEDPDMSSYHKQLLDTVAALPGVLSASFGRIEIPAGDTLWKDTVSLAATDTTADATRVAAFIPVSPGFFRTLAIAFVSGRDFSWSDAVQHPKVAIVDSNLARKLAPSGDVMGMRVRFGVQPDYQQLQIVGVVRSARLTDVRDSSAMFLYVPASQEPQSYSSLFVRVQHPGAIARSVEQEVLAQGQQYPASVKTLEQTNNEALAEDRATAMLSTMFAGLALLLVSIGLFGLMSYTVTRRTREIGIRLALGSQRGGILRLVLGESLLLSVAGIVTGVPCSLIGARLLTHILFGVAPHDLLTIIAAACALLAIGLLGGYWPARRAMKTDPMIALRAQ